MRLSELVKAAQEDLEKNGDREVRIATGARSLLPNATYDVVLYEQPRAVCLLGPGAYRVSSRNLDS